MKTFDELEREAYLAGNTQLAASYAAMEDLENVLNGADLVLDRSISTQIEEVQEKAIADNCPDYEEYKQFFYDCFERLGAHYPCPSVTSDYDKLVIFDAIEKGEL
jgi:hypothetical protein